jgi:hypothetical protein
MPDCPASCQSGNGLKTTNDAVQFVLQLFRFNIETKFHFQKCFRFDIVDIPGANYTTRLY